jgi:hypothetical protein
MTIWVSLFAIAAMISSASLQRRSQWTLRAAPERNYDQVPPEDALELLAHRNFNAATRSCSPAVATLRSIPDVSVTKRHRRGGVFLPDLAIERLKRVRAARAMISPARREKPCTSTGAGGVIAWRDKGCSPPCLSIG